MTDQQGILERTARRVLLSLARALVTTVNDAGGVQMMQVKLNALETRDNTPRAAEFGFTSNPPIGSDAFVVFLGGDRSNGVVLGTVHQQSRPINLAPGETMVYSQDGKSVYFSNNGIIVEAKGENVVVNDAADYTINCSGKFKVVAGNGAEFDTSLVSSTGDFQDNSGSNAATMKSMRQAFNPHTHPEHDGGNTSGPNTSM